MLCRWASISPPRSSLPKLPNKATCHFLSPLLSGPSQSSLTGPWRRATGGLVSFSVAFAALPLGFSTLAAWGPCLPGAWTALGWLCHFRGSFSQFPWLSCPISNLETSGRMTTWPGGSPSFPLSPPPGLAGLRRFPRSWKHQGAPLRGRRSPQKLDTALWKRAAQVGGAEEARAPGCRSVTPPPGRSSPKWPCAPTHNPVPTAAGAPAGCWVT